MGLRESETGLVSGTGLALGLKWELRSGRGCSKRQLGRRTYGEY